MQSSAEGPAGVLVVDDDPAVLAALSGLLAGPGREAVTAPSGPDALRLLEARDFACALLDLDLPGLDGFETARRARALPRSAETPVLFMTGHPAGFSVAEAYAIGAVDYLVKPVLPEVLLAKVAAFVDLFRKNERLRELERRERVLAEGQLRLVLESATEFAIFSTDAGGVVTTWNAGAERLFGFAGPEIVGHSGDVLFTPEDRAEGVPGKERWSAAETGRASDERWHLRRDGSRFFASGVMTPIRDPELRGFTKVARDVTGRKQAADSLRENEGRLRFLDALGEATRWAADPAEVMAASARLLGRHLRVTRCAYADVEPDGDRFTIRDDWTDGAVTTAGSYSLDRFGPRAAADMRGGRTLVVRDVDRELAPAEGADTFNAIGIKAIVCCPLVKGGRLAAMMAVHHAAPRDWSAADVALVEQVVERSWAHIERVRAEARLREEARLKDEFLAAAAHELRNPLAPVRYALHTLKLAAADLPAPARAAVEVMDRQVALLTRLLDDLLDVSRVSRGRVALRRERTDLRDAVRAAVETSRPLIDAAGHRLAVGLPDGPLPVEADPARLVQVFANLLNNAAKYTPAAGDIGVTAAAEAGRAVVRVRDTGEGIPPEVIGRIFELFVQAGRSPDRSHDGLGIGLALVRKLVEMHGGTVEAHSEGPGRGSEFVVRLPLA